MEEECAEIIIKKVLKARFTGGINPCPTVLRQYRIILPFPVHRSYLRCRNHSRCFFRRRASFRALLCPYLSHQTIREHSALLLWVQLCEPASSDLRLPLCAYRLQIWLFSIFFVSTFITRTYYTIFSTLFRQAERSALGTPLFFVHFLRCAWR